SPLLSFLFLFFFFFSISFLTFSFRLLSQAAERKKRSFVGAFLYVIKKIKSYFVTMANRRSPRRDLYVYGFIAECFSFILMAVFPQELLGLKDASVIDFWTDNLIPREYFYLLFAQFLFIISDRVFYLFKSNTAKLIFQYLYIVLVHTLLFVVMP